MTPLATDAVRLRNFSHLDHLTQLTAVLGVANYAFLGATLARVGIGVAPTADLAVAALNLVVAIIATYVVDRDLREVNAA